MTGKTCVICQSKVPARRSKYCSLSCANRGRLERAKKTKAHAVFMKLGLTQEDYDLLSFNADRCAICKQLETRERAGKIRQLCIDHSHITGLFRGFLCGSCNVGLGLFKDNIATLKQAIQYLERHKDPRDNT
jgi:hypothetical protein